MKQQVADLGATVGSLAAGLTSTAASICCIGPLAITLLGVNGAIVAAGIKPYRPYLLGGSLLMLVFASWRVYGRRAGREARGSESCPVVAPRWTKIILWAAVALWVLAVMIQVAADRYWLSGIG